MVSGNTKNALGTCLESANKLVFKEKKIILHSILWLIM